MQARWIGVALVAAATAWACNGSGGTSGPIGPASVGGNSGGGGAPVGGVDGGAGAGGTSDGGVAGDGGSPAAGCPASGPVKLADAHAVRKILVDESDVYYLDVASAEAGLYRVGKAGGAPTAMLPVRSLEDGGSGWDFALDDIAAYVVYGGAEMGAAAANVVTLVDKLQGATRTVAPTAQGCLVPQLTAVAAYDGTAWLAQDNVATSGCSAPPSQTLEILPLAAVDLQTVGSIAAPRSLLADLSHVFIGASDGTFRRAHDGGAPEQLAPVGLDALASDGNTLFGIDSGAVFAVAAPGQYRAVYSGPAAAAAVAVDDAHLYVATTAGVVRLDKDGSGAVTVAAANQPVAALAVDDTRVYYFGPEDALFAACK